MLVNHPPVRDCDPDSLPYWHCGTYRLRLDRPSVMGVLNVTPDSFSDGGRFSAVEAAVAHAQRLIDEGADILDIGGESTRPGAARVPPGVELQRVLPVLEALRGAPVPISVDTSQPDVIAAVLRAGASIINDVRSLAIPGALEAARDSDCGVVLMHMQGDPATMQAQPDYQDVLCEVGAWLARRRDAVVATGIERARIALDPGFGFGKSGRHNCELLAGMAALRSLGHPLLAGLSRKSTLGTITGRAVGERLAASVAAALIAVQNGARVVRVHDVAATRDALAVWEAVQFHEEKTH